MGFRKIICVDFDGVIHSYTSGWKAPDIADDPPVPGAVEWLRTLMLSADFEPQIYSSRSMQEGGILCMKEFLIRAGMTAEEVDAIKFPTQKPPAFLTIDDRAICFDGNFPTAHAMQHFVPWNKRDDLPSWWEIAVDEAGKHGLSVLQMPPFPDAGDGEGEARGVVLVKGEWKKKFCISALAEKNHADEIGDVVRRTIQLKAKEFERDLEYQAGRLKP